MEEEVDSFGPESVPLTIRRVSMPDWPKRPLNDERGVFAALGEQPEWGFATPWLFRALTSPLTNEPILAAPRTSLDHDDPTPLAYWSSLLAMLVYSFGWARPDRGCDGGTTQVSLWTTCAFD
jgi:hypothetical protein